MEGLASVSWPYDTGVGVSGRGKNPQILTRSIHRFCVKKTEPWPLVCVV